MDTIRIKDKCIGKGHPTYIIAEMSANHAGSIERAKEIIHAAKEAGADCVKIQTYTPDTLTIDCNNEYFQITSGTWQGENLYSLYGKAYTPWEWQKELKEEAELVGIDFLSTPFDTTAVDFLEDLGLEFYKIASFELVDLPLIKYVAAKGKPIIMSTGMGTLEEIQEAVDAVYSQGNKQLSLLKCSSAYPSISDDMHLATIKDMIMRFDIPIGLSDHSMGAVGACTAVALGASIIEKHICISREIDNPDASFSMTVEEFKLMVDHIRMVEKSIGVCSYGVSKQEEGSVAFRRSLFAVKDIAIGEQFSDENCRSIRPCHGLKPKYKEDILGMKAGQNIKTGTPLSFNLIRKHSILILSNQKNLRDKMSLISQNEVSLMLFQNKIELSIVESIEPQLLIISNYNYKIDDEIISYMKGKIINLSPNDDIELSRQELKYNQSNDFIHEELLQEVKVVLTTQ